VREQRRRDERHVARTDHDRRRRERVQGGEDPAQRVERLVGLEHDLPRPAQVGPPLGEHDGAHAGSVEGCERV